MDIWRTKNNYLKNMKNIKKFEEFHNIGKNVMKETEVRKNALSPINVGELKMLYEQEEVEKYLPLVWEMLEKSYEGIGGLNSYRDYNDFKKRKHLLMVVRDFNNKDLLACAVFRRIESSLKMTAIGCNQEDDGKLALQQIIQHTISKLELHYWTEVSGVIEYYVKKHNGFPIPNNMASKILGVPDSQITPSQKDMVHYNRVIGVDAAFTKMIYGIKSEEIFQEAMSEVEDYYDFMTEVNKMVNESKESKYSVRQAIYIIENLYTMHEDNAINELTPKWHDALRDSVEVLNSTKEKTQTISDYIEYGNFLLSDTQILTLNVIK